MPALVAAVIPAWNLWEMTRACLESLASNTPHGMLEVFVVDNGSTDATADALEPFGRSLFGERFRRIRFEENRGFAVASNTGARQAASPYVLFLNNDTLVLPGWLPPLLEAVAASPDGIPTGAAGPLLLYEGGERVQHYGTAFTYGGVQHLYAHFPSDHPAVLRPRRFQAMTAAALLMPRRLFLDIGLFHEGFRNGFEDLDLCRRLVDSGYALRAEPSSRIVHRESSTPGRKDHDRDNAALFAARYAHPIRKDFYSLIVEDGFEVCLSESLETWVCLAPKREAELNRLAAGLDIAAVWSMLRADPVWYGGYERLAEALRLAQRHEDEVFARVLQCQFFPSPGTYAGLEEAAELAGRSDLVVQARSGRERLLDTQADSLALKHKAALLSRQARREGDKSIEDLYLDWLRLHA